MRTVRSVIATVLIIFLAPLSAVFTWETWKWYAKPVPIKQEAVYNPEARKCMIAEVAKGATDRVGMIAVLAVVHNNTGSNGSEVCDLFKTYALMRAPSQSRESRAIRSPDFIVNLQGKFGFWGMRSRIPLAATIVDEYLKKKNDHERVEMFNDPTRSYLRCVVRYMPKVDWFWFNAAGTDEVKMRRELKYVFSNPGGSHFFCPKQ